MLKVSDRDNRKGAGVYLEDGSWFYLPWTGIIKDTRMGRNLSLLEGLAALFGGIVATIRYPGRPVVVREDNLGFVYIYKSGKSSCRLCCTVAKAIMDVGRNTGGYVSIVKLGRVSGHGEIMADASSKT